MLTASPRSLFTTRLSVISHLQVKQGKAFIAGTETLCGSIAPMDECVRIFQKATGKILAADTC